MDQTVTELPDPLEKPPPGAAAAGTDELLARLAGDEIDRLLAEADVQRGEKGAIGQETARGSAGVAEREGGAETEPPQPDVDPETAKQLDALFEQLTAGGPQPAPTTTTTAPVRGLPLPQQEEADPQLARQLDELFEQLNAPLPGEKKDKAAASGAAPAAASEPAEVEPGTAPAAIAATAATMEAQGGAPAAAPPPAAPQPAAAAVSSAAADPAEQTGALERQVLTADILGTANAESGEDAPAQEPPADDGDDRLPLYLRPLEWLNAPLANCSDAVREAIAKVAIMTLVNALALLAYVLFFRHR